MKLFTNMEFGEAQRSRLTAIVSPDGLYFGDPEEPTDSDCTAFLESDIGFGWCPPEWLEEAKNLSWMQFDSVGVGEYACLDWDKLSRRLVCTNLKGFFAVPVAETAMAGILALYRGIFRLIDLKATRTWMKLDLRLRLKTLADAEVLLVGYGAFGVRMRELLAPFGCTVKAYDKFAEGAELREPSEFHAALPEADVICAALPETPETRGLFSRERLDMMKTGAVFVNVGRGSVVDEDSLMGRLRSGRLAGAVLDVTNQEPLPATHPLWDCPNTIITQHTAGGSSDELDRKLDFFADNLRRYRDGLPLNNIVDWKRGF